MMGFSSPSLVSIFGRCFSNNLWMVLRGMSLGWYSKCRQRNLFLDDWLEGSLGRAEVGSVVGAWFSLAVVSILEWA